MARLLKDGDHDYFSADLELPDTQTIKDGAIIKVSRILQGATVSIDLENTTDDVFCGDGIGEFSSGVTTTQTVTAGTTQIWVSSREHKCWIRQ